MWNKGIYYSCFFSALLSCCSFCAPAQTLINKTGLQPYNHFDPSAYNVEWLTPGNDAKGSMPIGNGDMGANVWVDHKGDLNLILSKTDAFDECNRLLKLGALHIKTTPSIIANDGQCSQSLQLKEGYILIKTGSAEIRVWTDANHPALQIDIQSAKPVQVEAWIENWRNKHRILEGREAHSAYGNQPADKRVNPDSVIVHGMQYVAVCHRNIESVWKKNMELTGLQNEMQHQADPLLNRCFGMMVYSKKLYAINDTLLKTKQPVNNVSINVFTRTNFSTCAGWMEKTIQLKNILSLSRQQRFEAHKKWWRQYWDRSWIEVTGANGFDSGAWKVSQIYALQRYINACAGRGRLPIKFNGSIFTVNENYDADFRMWGGCYWWQNTRLPYWSMLYSGDYDLMQPLFKMHMEALPLREAAAQKYYHHSGAFFPETINFWGNYNDENYGIDRTDKEEGLTENTYIRRYWQSGLELITLMLDYYDNINSLKFAKDTLIPIAKSVTTFYNEHWKRNDSGMIVFSPAQSLETWHSAVNPTPDIAGLRYLLPRLLKLDTDTANKKLWRQLLNSLPAIPLAKENNQTYLLPAQSFSQKSNVENCELYAVFPYRLFTVLANKNNYQIGLSTWNRRVYKEDMGWQQNCFQAALLGLANEAQQMIVGRVEKKAAGYRFPGFFGPNYDWTPDQDHPSGVLIALQRMLMQCEGDRIVLLPAWPSNWNVHFKLYAPCQTTVIGKVENKQLKMLDVFPVSRRKDVEIKN